MTNPGERIRELRKLINMSQEELGRRVGVQRAAIQKYEKGTVQNIPLQTIEEIAKVLDVSPTYLVGWDEMNYNQLALEVRIINGVQRLYGKDAVELLEIHSNLSNIGKKRVYQYFHDMGQLYSLD